MKLGVCTSVENAVVVREAGFDFIEENVQGLLIGEKTDEEFAPKLEAVRHASFPVLSANCFLPGPIKCVGPEADEDRLARYAQNVFRRGRACGIKHVVFGSGGARQIPDGFPHEKAREQFLAGLRRIVPLAEAEGVIIVIEPLNSKECNHITSLAEGAAYVEELNHPNLRLLADFWHMSVDGESPKEIIVHGRWLAHVHVAELNGRKSPGVSGEDFGPYLRALKEADYKGDISFECTWDNLAEQAAPSQKNFREQVRAAGF